MITIDNYFEKCRNINFDNLPSALKNGNKLTTDAAANNWSAYNSNENIRRVVKAYMEKLEEYLEKNPQNKPQSEKKAEKPVRSSSKTPRPKKEKQGKAKKGKGQRKEPELVEKVQPEVQFIKRYVGLHGKVKTQDEILRFLDSLQKAILEKRIRKTSPYSSEIENIQEQLIKCYEKMGDAIELTIDKDSLEKYEEIAYSQKSLLSVAYIKQYISLHGKKNVKEKAQALLDKLQKAVKKAKIQKDDPYSERLNAIYNALINYIEGKSDSPQISKSELNGLFSFVARQQRKKK